LQMPEDASFESAKPNAVLKLSVEQEHRFDAIGSQSLYYDVSSCRGAPKRLSREHFSTFVPVILITLL
jgi:hypothetical protein